MTKINRSDFAQLMEFTRQAKQTRVSGAAIGQTCERKPL